MNVPPASVAAKNETSDNIDARVRLTASSNFEGVFVVRNAIELLVLNWGNGKL